MPPLRIRPDEATLLRVVSGSVRLTVLGEERLLEPGDEAIVPAAHAHRLAGAGAEARVVMGFRSTPL
jgi:mannose-6-phosphate isomerase-like protein (cupin superfamily)